MNLTIPTSTWIWLIAIFVVFAICLFFVFRFKKNGKLVANRRIVEYFPTFVSTLGVLGTFYGMTIGLLSFDTGNLDQSIPGLLDGLKTAFFTSLAGMIGSMILSGFISKKQDENDGGVSDINQAAGTICQAVQQMSELNKQTIEQLANQMVEQEKDRKAFYRSMGDVMDNIKESQTAIAETLASINSSQASTASAIDSLVILQRSQESSLDSIKEASEGMVSSIGNLEEATSSQTSSLVAIAKSSEEIAQFTHHTGEILDVVSGMANSQEEINEQVQKLKSILDA